MKRPAAFFLLTLGCLALAGCAADEERGLCSYLGGCMESDDDDDSGISAPAIGKPASQDHNTADHGAGGGHDEGGVY